MRGGSTLEHYEGISVFNLSCWNYIFNLFYFPSFILLYLSLVPLAGVKNENRKLEASLTSCFRIAQPDMNTLMSILLTNNNTSRT